MGAIANEQTRPTVNHDINRGDDNVLSDVAPIQHVMKIRFVVTMIRFRGEEVRRMCTKEFFTKNLAYKMAAVWSTEWDVVYVTDKESHPKTLTAQAI